MTTAPRGAAIVDFFERRRKHRLHSRSTAPNQLAQSLDRLRTYRRALDAWDQTGGNRPMPQPSDFDLELPNLRPSWIHLGGRP